MPYSPHCCHIQMPATGCIAKATTPTHPAAEPCSPPDSQARTLAHPLHRSSPVQPWKDILSSDLLRDHITYPDLCCARSAPLLLAHKRCTPAALGASGG